MPEAVYASGSDTTLRSAGKPATPWSTCKVFNPRSFRPAGFRPKIEGYEYGCVHDHASPAAMPNLLCQRSAGLANKLDHAFVPGHTVIAAYRGTAMIRGAIEVANRSIISGWLYASAVDLRGQLVLAFVGTRHVGTGKIELFRKDIKEAGLGDGYSGFYFPVTLKASDQPESITIRLDQSDLVLLNKSCAVSAAPAQKVARAASF